MPPKLTAVAPDKNVPLITTGIVTPAVPGVKLVIVGGGARYVKPARLPIPPAVVTDTAPVVLPAATVALICVGEITVKLVAGTPPKRTCVAPVKCIPVSVTTAPGAAFTGIKLVMTGVGTHVKPAKLLVPPGPVTETLPLAPPATTAFI